MTSIVREHNLLNGFWFALVEYTLAGLGLGLLAGYYLVVGRYLEATLWAGIVANCLVIVVFAAGSIRRGRHDFGHLPLRRPEFRAWVAETHPTLGRWTTLLIATQLVPYLLTLLVVIDRIKRRT